MSAELPDASLKSWYRNVHDARCRASGQAFEDYVTSILARLHSDFVNPDPMGSLGDGGCDGLAEAGTILYACYGSQATTNIDAKVAAKLESDLLRAVGQWNGFTTWRFVTNSPFGVTPTAKLAELQHRFEPGSERPLTLRLWRAPDDLWKEAASKLTADQLNEVLPGAPHAQNVELAVVIELIMSLEASRATSSDDMSEVRPVPVTKMDYNQIDEQTRIEFNAGRASSKRIDRWFDEQAEPGLRDATATSFRAIYTEALKSTDVPSEIVERLYVGLGGSDFRLDARRKDAVYAVTVYFFDYCDIFERPPDGWMTGGDDDAAAH
ncbi:MAG: hypothetical protein LBK54_06440 [Propionibacteriaceae bacterium]|nr:hypothetical protein [Propionibacteriaceae bacterium]